MSHTPIRMCVVCRGRFPQPKLTRLQCRGRKVVEWSGEGRSFYLCFSCKNSPKLYKILSKICRVDREQAKKIAKEIGQRYGYES
ncbi:MAG: DUF448 domain-containing protein [Campylobacterales bacterium]